MQDKTKSAIEAILFACGEPIEIPRIAQALELSEERVKGVIESLREEYLERGINVLILGDSAQMTSAPDYAPKIRAILDLRKSLPLSQAALEVLSVVAYNEPVTKAFIEGVRGVDCSGVMSSPMAKNLLEERGRLELPGRLRCMNLSSLADLPPVKTAEPNGAETGQEAQPPLISETDDTL